MKPFLIGSQLPPDPEPVPPYRSHHEVYTVLETGAWFTRKQLEQATGLSCGNVNMALQHGIRRGAVQREYPLLRGCTKAITQRYRLAERRAS